MPPQLSQPKKPHTIPTATAALMVAVALLFDGAQLATDLVHVIPVAGTILQSLADWIVTVWAWLTFYLWFKLKNVSFMKPSRAALLNGGGLIELIPVLNSLPAWTLAVVLLIATTRAEELLEKIPGGAKLATVAQKAGGAPDGTMVSPPKLPAAAHASSAHTPRIPPHLSDIRSPA